MDTNENAKINIGFLMISRRLEEHSRRLHPVLLLELPSAKLPSADISKQGQLRRRFPHQTTKHNKANITKINVLLITESLCISLPDESDLLREDFKYYFADFVRKGGTPPPFGNFPEIHSNPGRQASLTCYLLLSLLQCLRLQT